MWTAKPEISKAEPQVIKKLIINQCEVRAPHTSKGLKWDFLSDPCPFPEVWVGNIQHSRLHHISVSEQLNADL